MRFRVVIQISGGAQDGHRRALKSNQSLVIGRTGDADWECPSDPQMSARHFEIRTENGVCRLRDLGSTAGTLVDNQPTDQCVLKAESVIQAGNTRFRCSVQGGDTEAAEQIAESIESHRSMLGVEQPRQPIAVALETCFSQSIRATQADGEETPLTVLHRLANVTNVFTVVDFHRFPDDAVSGLDASAALLLMNLDPTVAAELSPSLSEIKDAKQIEALIRAGWEMDALMFLFSAADQPTIRSHFQKITTVAPQYGEAIAGYCWPSILAAALMHGKPDQAVELFGPIEAILTANPQAAGGWQLVGTPNLETLLTEARFELAKPSEARATGASDTAEKTPAEEVQS
jgi:hypothetical protein